MNEELEQLAMRWAHSSRQRFDCADRTSDPTGKHVMQSTAVTYANCHWQLLAILKKYSPPQEATP